MPDREVIGIAKDYTHMAHVAKRKDNQEFLIIVSPKPKGVSYA